MRSIYKIVVCSLLTLSITSCEKDLLEKEQYQKEIYLIGAYNRVWTTEVSYSNEEVKTYFTVSSSGTLALDRDVNVKMKINEELKAFFLSIGIELVDFKIEFGRYHGQIILADEISPDTCRLWDVKTHDKLDKDRFRRDLGGVEEAYQEVMRRLGL